MRHAGDGVEGGADLVAHVRQELALGPGGGLGRGAGLAGGGLGAPLGDLRDRFRPRLRVTLQCV